MAEILFVSGFVALVCGLAGYAWQVAAIVGGVLAMGVGWRLGGAGSAGRGAGAAPRR